MYSDRSKPMSINIPSNRNVDVQLHWRQTNEVQHRAKMPTWSAVGCENRTSSGTKFFIIPAQDLICFNRVDAVCGCKHWNEKPGMTLLRSKGLVFVVLTSVQASYHLTALSVWKAWDTWHMKHMLREGIWWQTKVASLQLAASALVSNKLGQADCCPLRLILIF